MAENEFGIVNLYFEMGKFGLLYLKEIVFRAMQKKRLTKLWEIKMCPTVIDTNNSIVSIKDKTCWLKSSGCFVLMCVFIFSLLMNAGYAQNKSEEYLEVKNWKAPQNAVLFKDIVLQDSIHIYKGKPFTGIAIEYYNNGALQRFATFVKGKQNGPMFIWYPDGSPEMSANFIDGYLQGRFLGWYNNGSVIYDLMINKGTYAGDNLWENDESQAGSEEEDLEREGPDNDQSAE
ncbi:MAG: hypothetical protein ABFC98_02310 [Candidatus Cloacimonas sp.]